MKHLQNSYTYLLHLRPRSSNFWYIYFRVDRFQKKMYAFLKSFKYILSRRRQAKIDILVYYLSALRQPEKDLLRQL